MSSLRKQIFCRGFSNNPFLFNYKLTLLKNVRFQVSVYVEEGKILYSYLIFETTTNKLLVILSKVMGFFYINYYAKFLNPQVLH